MIGEVRRTILTILLNAFAGRTKNLSDVGFMQDYHYDMAEQFYLGKISREDYVGFLQAAKYQELDNLQMLSLVDELDDARTRTGYHESGRAITDSIYGGKMVEYYVVPDGFGKHIFSSYNDAMQWSMRNLPSGAPPKIEVWQSYRQQ